MGFEYLGIPVVAFFPCYVGFSLKLNIRKKGTLIIMGLLRNPVLESLGWNMVQQMKLKLGLCSGF